MANLNNFNANNVEPAADFDPIPAGKYVAVITDSEMKATKNGKRQLSRTDASRSSRVNIRVACCGHGSVLKTPTS